MRYKVRAQAVNELGPSDWGQYSAEDNPAGVPAAPAAPTTSVASSVGTSNQLKVNWSEPNTNGDAIKSYYVTMSGGGGATQTQMVAGTVRTANFTANNSETGYTFTVQAENKAGKGAVSAASAPRRATGKLGQVSGVSATAADTGGAGRAVVINFRELDTAGRNGSQPGEVSYTYYASPSGKTGGITPGQKVGGFTNGTPTTITVTANSSVAPSSDASTGATTTPYGAPGTPSASGQNGAENQRSLSFSWSSPSTTTNDVAYTQISIDNGGWERVAASGSRTINTGGFSEPHSIRVQTVNSLGTGGPIASASAQSGAAKTRWSTRLNTGMDRSCTDLPGATSYDPNAFTCDGQGGYDRPWMSHFDSFDVMCWKPHGTPYGGDGQWYYIMRGSPNGTRWINSTHTLIGPPAQSGVPGCDFPVGATP